MTASDLVLKEAELQQSVNSLTSQLPAEITCDEQRVEAIAVCRQIKFKIGDVNAAYDDLIAEAHKHHRNLIAKRDKYRDPLVAAHDRIERAITAFKEREKAKAEQLRIAAEAEAHKKQQSDLFAEAEMLEKQGNHAEAEQVLQEAVTAPAPMVVVQPSYSKVKGEYTRNLPWQFEIRDAALIADHYWCPDLDAIGAIVKAKGSMAENIIGKGSIRIWRGSKTVIRS